MGRSSGSFWGSHAEFAELYERFLDSVYNRDLLVEGIASELRRREVRSVLDCAAGTGFPAVELATCESHRGLAVHCTDADLEMLTVLAARSKAKGLSLSELTPPMGRTLGESSVGSLRVDWKDLGEIRRTYDYVMCRGNSLAYADSWGGREFSSPIDTVRQYLVEIASKVDYGGYLHVDAPLELALPRQNYLPVGPDGILIWEQVGTEAEHRHWRVDFKLVDDRTAMFERFSTLLTICEVKQILDDLQFDETDPIQLKGERPGYGVIIARKPLEVSVD